MADQMPELINSDITTYQTEGCSTSTDNHPKNVKTKQSKFFMVGTEETSSDLQSAFLKYKKKKQKEIKRARKQKQIPDEARKRALADPDRMWRLRMKFVEQAKKYFGVPYAKKYWKPEDPEHKSKIFLDCCALVRRAMRDLQKDFGFRIGPWNQSYQHDTLPVVIDREADMKPGDLVFISAIYHNPKTKKQRHNLTHVEIWLGDGPKTIGARWQKGKVQVFDSYRFNATSYHSEKYIFKSLDTWLMGICRSHCGEHTWRMRSEMYKPEKRSIFLHPEAAAPTEDNKQVEGEAADESAGDTDQELMTAPDDDMGVKPADELIKEALLNSGQGIGEEHAATNAEARVLEELTHGLAHLQAGDVPCTDQPDTPAAADNTSCIQAEHDDEEYDDDVDDYVEAEGDGEEGEPVRASSVAQIVVMDSDSNDEEMGQTPRQTHVMYIRADGQGAPNPNLNAPDPSTRGLLSYSRQDWTPSASRPHPKRIASRNRDRLPLSPVAGADAEVAGPAATHVLAAGGSRTLPNANNSCNDSDDETTAQPPTVCGYVMQSKIIETPPVDGKNTALDVEYDSDEDSDLPPTDAGSQ